MKMVWQMQRERMTDGLHTYFFFVCLFYFLCTTILFE